MNVNVKVPRCHTLKIQRKSTTLLYFTGRETRNRRQAINSHVRELALRNENVMLTLITTAVDGYREIPREKVCPDGKRKPSGKDEADCVWNQNKEWKVRCEIRTRTCYYIDVCDTLDGCFEEHIYNTIYCCKYVCV